MLLKKPEPDPRKPKNLSNREWQVMLELVQGKKVSVIAKELGLNIKTVSTYKARVLSKTGYNTSELAIQAYKQQLVGEPGKPSGC